MIQKLTSLLKKKNHLIFDFDLTIAKMKIDWSKWHMGMAEIYSQFDLNHGYGKGINPHHFYNQMVEKHGDELVHLAQKFNAKYEAENAKGFIPYQELVDLIKELNDKSLYIYSSNSGATVRKGLEELGILNSFQQIISRDEVSFLKPNPEGFELIKDFEENKKSFLMIGDSSSDEGVAKAVGIDFLKCDYFGTYKF